MQSPPFVYYFVNSKGQAGSKQLWHICTNVTEKTSPKKKSCIGGIVGI